MSQPYSPQAPTFEQVENSQGPTVLDFGTNWCGFCRAAQPAVEEALSRHPDVRHVKVEDGRGRALGRSFRVKVWPTLVFLRDGEEVERLVRPRDPGEVAQALAKITA